MDGLFTDVSARMIGLMDGDATGVVVEEATGGNVAAFASFFWRAWTEAEPGAPGFVGATDQIIEELITPEAVRQRIGGPERRMFLAWDGEEVVGFGATRRVDDETVELAGVIVLESYSGRGIGSGLIDEAMDRVRAEGYRRMIVRTEVTNERARAVYEARGFAVSGSMSEAVEGEAVEVWELSRDIN